MEINIHVFNGGVTFTHDSGFFYVKSSYYIDGADSDAVVDNSIGIKMTEKEIDQVINLLKDYKASH